MSCDRCDSMSNVFRMSIFNTDMLCPECQKKERQHPMYLYAKKREREEVINGNYNFGGIGLPQDLCTCICK